VSRQAKSEKPNEYDVFNAALKKVLSVPHSKIKAKLSREKGRRSKISSASRAANAKD
jgi:hypothetical protein